MSTIFFTAIRIYLNLNLNLELRLPYCSIYPHVPAHLGHRISAEFLNHRQRKLESYRCLTHYTCRGHGTHIGTSTDAFTAALVLMFTLESAFLSVAIGFMTAWITISSHWSCRLRYRRRY